MSLCILVLSGAAVADDETPPLLAEQGGKLLVEQLVAQVAKLDGVLTFVIRREDQRRFRLGDVIALASPGSAVVQVSDDTRGAACTALLAIRHIAPEQELLILAANEILDIDYFECINSFRSRGLDAATIVFPSIHPRYSYVKLDETEAVVEISEKRPISRLATAGFYWYRRGGDFVVAAQDMIRKDAHVNGNFFVSLTFNQLILRQKRLGVSPIPRASYHPLKSMRQIMSYENELGEEKPE